MKNNILRGYKPLDAKVLTPNGWSTIGQLKIGDNIISNIGSAVKVLDISQKEIKPIYKIITTENKETECCENSLWIVKPNTKSQFLTKSTKDIINSLEMNCSLLRNEVVNFDNKNMFIPPYTLGVIIGDGTARDTKIKIYGIDKDIINKVISEINTIGYTLTKIGSMSYNVSSLLGETNHPGRRIKITNILTNETKIFNSIVMASKALNIKEGALYQRCERKMIIKNIYYELLEKTKYHNLIKNAIYDLGLYGVIGWDKFIPNEYKYSSINSRIELVRGLMDTDGTIKKNGEVSSFRARRLLPLGRRGIAQ